MILFWFSRLEAPHWVGAAAIAAHWIWIYVVGHPVKQFTPPAVGAMTALYCFGVYLRKEQMDDLATAAFAWAGIVGVVIVLFAGMLAPGVV